MKFGTIINIGIANICCMTATPGELSTVPNSGPGGSSQICYTAYGTGTTSADGESLVHTEGGLVDISRFRNKPLTGQAGPNGVTWVSVNPFDEETLDYEFLEGPSTRSFTNTRDHCTILTVKGVLGVNAAQIPELGFCRVGKDQTISLTLGTDVKAIILQK